MDYRSFPAALQDTIFRRSINLNELKNTVESDIMEEVGNWQLKFDLQESF
jgi:hypothetical protein